MQRTRNPLRVQILRGFESHRFRQTGQKLLFPKQFFLNLPPKYWVCIGGGFNFKGHSVFRRPWIRISSATLGYQWLEQIQEYSGLTLNQYGVASPCRTICTVCGFSPCPDLNLIHYKTLGGFVAKCFSWAGKDVNVLHCRKGRYATAYWPFSVMESCTSNANPPSLKSIYSELTINQYGVASP